MEIGGDYFDYVPLDDGRLALVVADVSGKGLAAALIMATFRASLRAELRRASDVEEVIQAVDRLLLESIDQARYVTAVFGVLDPRSGEFVLRELRSDSAAPPSRRRHLRAARLRAPGTGDAGVGAG